MEQILKTIILGLIQGLTEWLPISSTGHLKLAEHLLNLKLPILFDVILHIGTLLVVLTFFREDVKKIVSAAKSLDFKTEYGKLVPLIIVGTIPTALMGLTFAEKVESTFSSPLPIAVAFIFCGAIIYSAKFGKEKTDNIGYSTAFLIGLAQGVAIIPGISRSGATIATALLIGLKREKAFKFSFLLSIPALAGAFGLTLYTQIEYLSAAGLGLAEICLGTATAMVVGYLSLKLLWKALFKGKFHLFGFYCILLGAALILGLSVL
ncbi:MAG: undecaprenyl-diphosphate phosphatase [Candidatus Bathyarchaeia archaeon]